jgi:hypothetical protein
MPTERDDQSDALAALETFEAWADRAGVDLGPAFDRREQSPLLSRGSHPVAVVPVVALAFCDGNDVGAVFPCTAADRTRTVGDALDALEAGHVDEFLDPLWTPVPSGQATDETADIASR